MHRLILSALFFLFFVSLTTGSDFRAVGLATSGQESASSILARYPALEGAWVLEGKSWRQFPQDHEHLGAGMAAWVKKTQLTGEESSYIPSGLQIQFPGYAFVVWPGKDDVRLDESGVEGLVRVWSYDGDWRTYPLMNGYPLLETVSPGDAVFLETDRSDVILGSAPFDLIEGGAVGEDLGFQESLQLGFSSGKGYSYPVPKLLNRAEQSYLVEDFAQHFLVEFGVSGALNGQTSLRYRLSLETLNDSDKVLSREILRSQELEGMSLSDIQEVVLVNDGRYRLALELYRKGKATLRRTMVLEVRRPVKPSLAHIFEALQSSDSFVKNPEFDPAARIASIEIRVTAEGMSPVVSTFNGLTARGVVQVPPGLGRRFVITFRDSSGDIIRQGEDTIDLIPGEGAAILDPQRVDLGIADLLIQPSGGYFLNSVSVTMQASDANVFYTVDGSNPKNTNGLLGGEQTPGFPEFFEITETTTILAYTQKPGGDRGPVYETRFEKTVRPTLEVSTDREPFNDKFLNGVGVQITASDPNAVIFYSTSESGVTTASPFGVGVVNLNFSQDTILHTMARSPEGFFSLPESRFFDVLTAPEVAASNLTFQDQAPERGVLGGILEFDGATPESEVDFYSLFLANSSLQSLSSQPIATFPAGLGLYSFEVEDLELPLNATQWVVYTQNSAGISSVRTSIQFLDAGPPRFSAASLNFSDQDPDNGEISGVLSIAESSNAGEEGINQYEIFYSTSARQIISSNPLAVIETSQGLQGSLIPNTQIATDATHFLVLASNEFGSCTPEQGLLVPIVDFFDTTPVANAGLDQNGFTNVPLILDGSLSTAPNGVNLLYSWVITSRPATSSSVIANPSLAITQFVPDQIGQYEVELTVFANSSSGPTSSDRVVFTVEELPASEAVPVEIASRDHNCSLNSDGKIFCWGLNFNDQVDASAGNIVAEPVPIRPLQTYVDLDVSQTHSCAVENDGTLDCWGANFNGELGVSPNSVGSGFIESIAGFDDVIEVATGENSTCVLHDHGRVSCFGNNFVFQLGTRVNDQTHFPQLVFNVWNVQSITSGLGHYCSLSQDNSVHCWGAGSFGILGVNTEVNHASPVEIVTYENEADRERILEIESGDFFNCYRTESGRVFCWGSNELGSLGIGNLESRVYPVEVKMPGNARALELELGANHACATLENDQTACWGLNQSAVITPDALSLVSVPVIVDDLAGARQFGLGLAHSCGIFDFGVVKCKGAGANGQLGDGFAQNSDQVVTISSFGASSEIKPVADFVVLGEAANHTAVLSGHILLDASLSYILNEEQLSYEYLILEQPANSQASVSVVTGPVGILVADLRGDYLVELVVTSSNFEARKRRLIQVEENRVVDPIVDVFAGDHSCSLHENGELKCWGQNNSGQFGKSHFEMSPTPVLTEFLDVRFASLGRESTCVIDELGDLYCAGENDYSQLGIDSTTNSELPIVTKVNLPGPALQVSQGDYHSCVLLENGEVYCVGYGGFFANGRADAQNSSEFTKIQLPFPARQITAGQSRTGSGASNTCILDVANQVYCFGSGNNGQLGNGRTNSRAVPDRIAAPSDLEFVQVSSGSEFSCALGLDGSVYCWGLNDTGTLGNGSNQATSSYPVKVRNLPQIRQIATGSSHACAISTNAQLYCWGSGSLGENGSRDRESLFLPSPVFPSTTFSRISAGVSHNCALTTEGKVVCFGSNFQSELGGNVQNFFSSDLVDVKGLEPAVAKPVAYAGPDLQFPLIEMQLDGSLSYSPTGQALQYLWNFIEVPAGSNVTNSSLDLTDPARPIFTPDLPGLYRLSLRVGQSDGKFSRLDEVAVTFLDQRYASVVDLEVGAHSCVVNEVGRISCFGRGDNGQLGNGFGDNTSLRQSYLSSGDFIQVGVGDGFTCGLREGGTVVCNGINSSGQLGTGDTSPRTLPELIPSFFGVHSLSVGRFHSCAIRDQGEVWCWGLNSNGQLGNNSQANSPVPTRVIGIENARTVAIGSYHTCATLKDGSAWCWGNSASGRLGNGFTSGNFLTPQPVAQVEGGYRSFALGEDFSCGLSYDGRVACFGYGADGQLGNGSGISKSSPGLVTHLPRVRQLKSGDAHVCALGQDNTLYCWGKGLDGQLGSRKSQEQFRPFPVQNLENIVQFDAGRNSTCVVDHESIVSCFGDNAFGGLGTRVSDDLLAPTEINGFPAVRTPAPVAIAEADLKVRADQVGGDTVSLLLEGRESFHPGNDNITYNWALIQGAGSASIQNPTTGAAQVQLTGFGNYSFRLTVTDSNQLIDTDTVSVDFLGDSDVNREVNRLALYKHGCFINQNGQLFCFGENGSGQLGLGDTQVRSAPNLVPLSFEVVDVSVGEQHSCVLSRSGEVHCAGAGTNGQLGRVASSSATFQKVANLPAVVSLSSGGWSNCAIDAIGELYCWGWGAQGQLGNGEILDQSTPVKVHDLEEVAQVDIGTNHACARLQDGSIWCFGNNSNRKLGNPVSTRSAVPVKLGMGDQRAVDMSIGENHGCFVNDSGELFCWGDGDRGRLGRSSGVDEEKPIRIAVSDSVYAVSAGFSHTCALTSNGTYCFGANDHGELALDKNQVYTPTRVGEFDGAHFLVAGFERTCLLQGANGLKCSGNGQGGALANGSVSDQSKPKRILFPKTLGNQAPVANIRIMGREDSDFMLSAVGSFDPEGDNMNFNWEIASPANTSSSISGFGFGAAGFSPAGFHKYRIRLEVSDGSNTTTREMVIQPDFQVHAGQDVTAAVNQLVYLNGASSSQGEGLSYTWELTGPGGSSASITNPTSLVTQFQPDVVGDYLVRLRGVADGKERSSSFVVKVQAANTDPGFSPEQISLWNNTCVIDHQKRLRCGGLNSFGSVGMGSTGNQLVLTTIDSRFLWNQVEQGNSHSCAINSLSQVHCWGSGSNGKLGTGNNSNQVSPQPTLFRAGAIDLALGNQHSCVLNFDGTVECAGDGAKGSMGNGRFLDQSTPVAVSNLDEVIDIASFDEHTCAVRRNKEVYCWGEGTLGQLGNGSTQNQAVPVKVQGNYSFDKIETGAGFSCGLATINSESQLLCWGANGLGQLGLGFESTEETFPQIVREMDDVLDFSLGNDHVCAAEHGGSVYCWGNGADGRTGLGTNLTVANPREAAFPTPIVDVEAGAFHTCGISRTGGVYCMGSQVGGRLVNGQSSGSLLSATTILPDVFVRRPIPEVRMTTDLALRNVGLSAALSRDPYRRTLAYHWQLVNKPFGSNATVSSTNTVNTNFTIDKFGQYDFILGVSLANSPVVSSQKRFSIHVVPEMTLAEHKFVITNTINQLVGEVKLDPLANALAYSWTLLTQPSGSNLSLTQNNSRVLSFNPQVTGNYQLRLSASDGSILLTDTINVTALSATSRNTETIQLSLGTNSCALNSDGRVQCWGPGSAGANGNGTVNNALPGSFVLGLNNVVQLDTHSNHSCAVKQNGEVWCWGEGSSGELGNQQALDSNIPVQVFGINNAVAVAMGLDHACALLDTGKVNCWGRNIEGQLGNGNLVNSSSPVEVKRLDNVIRIEAGQYHTCALDERGRVSCWGYGANGRLGNRDISNSSIPVFAPVPDRVRDIEVGDEHSCALTLSGTMYCWGRGNSGELGTGILADSRFPVKSILDPQIQEVVLGDAISCVRYRSNLGNREWSCFGKTANQLLLETANVAAPHPRRMKFLDEYVQLSIGDAHACGVHQNGLVACYGLGTSNRLGTSSAVSTTIPTNALSLGPNPNSSPVVKLEYDRTVYAGETYIYAHRSFDPEGQNTNFNWTITPNDGTAQIQNIGSFSNVLRLRTTIPGSYTIRQDLTASSDLSTKSVTIQVQSTPTMGARAVFMSDNSCLVDQTGKISCTGPTINDASVPKPWIDAMNVVDMDSMDHSCIVTASGQVHCYGEGSNGELGNGVGFDSAQAVQVTSITDAVQVAVGFSHTCVLRENGKVACFGRNVEGQLGTGNMDTGTGLPVEVTGLSNVVKIEAGDYFNCALDAKGRVACWGYNSNGRLGLSHDGHQSAPVYLNFEQEFITDLQVGLYHSCVLSESGKVFCWGENNKGSSGHDSMQDLTSPEEVTIPGLARQIALGDDHTCVLNDSDNVYCFGDNSEGQLGQSNYDQTAIPQQVLGTGPVATVFSGFSHSCALSITGKTWCWGNSTGFTGAQINNQFNIDESSFIPRSYRQPPVANAGTNRVVKAGVVNLSGRASYDPDGAVVSYNWALGAAPTNVAITDPNQREIQLTLTDAGTYNFTLAVTDNQGLTSTDGVAITVENSPVAQLEQIEMGPRTCHVFSDGSLKCYGPGSISNGIVHDSRVSNVKEIALGTSHACALNQAGEVHCYGDRNLSGELGNGSFTNTASVTQVALPEPIRTLDATLSGSTCAVSQSGKVYCWGTGSSGEIGNASTSRQSTATRASFLDSILEVSSGYYHHCALNTRGQAVCWGGNGQGQLGIGSVSGLYEPAILDLDELTQVESGDQHSCAVNAQGDLYCWGQNSYGQLGTGDFENQSTPQLVFSNVARVSAGARHTCAMTRSGEVMCWGDNADFQIGNSGSTPFPRSIQIPGGVQVLDIESGMNGTCLIVQGLSQNGIEPVCFGDNGQNILGTGVHGSSSDPASVPGFENFPFWTPRVDAGVNQQSRRGFFVLNGSSTRTRSVGANLTYQWSLVNAPAGSSSPAIVNPSALVTTFQADVLGSYTFQLTGVNPGNGESYSDTVVMDYNLNAADDAMVNVVSMDAGAHFCALDGSGEVACFGANLDYQLGHGDTAPVSRAKKLDFGQNVKAVATGLRNSCVVLEDSTAQCVGRNSFSSLGTGSNAFRMTNYAPVLGLDNIHSMGLGVEHACALTNDGQLYCAGGNTYGAIGQPSSTPSTTLFTLVEGLSNLNLLSVGDYHTCVADRESQIYCFGYGSNGSVGDGLFQNAFRPRRVADLQAPVVELATASDHSCALLETGEVYCWGRNNSGQLGQSLNSNFGFPVRVNNLPDVKQISAGGESTCALGWDNSAYCWGDNSDGQITDTSHGSQLSSPVQLNSPEPVALVTVSTDAVCQLGKSGRLFCRGNSSNLNLTRADSSDGRELRQVIGIQASDFSAPYVDMGPSGATLEAPFRLSPRRILDRSDSQLSYQWQVLASPAGSNPQIVDINEKSLKVESAEPGVYLFGLSVGNGSFATTSTIEVTVTDTAPQSRIEGIVDFSLRNHGCLVDTNSRLHCWGEGQSGELALGQFQSFTAPVRVPDLESVSKVAVGDNHSCVVFEDGRVACAGSNVNGQLGTGDLTSDSGMRFVTGVFNAVDVSAGAQHSCILHSNSTVSCFGTNSNLQVGGSFNRISEPFQVPGLNGIVALESGGYHNCAIDQSGDVFCWGYNGFGQTGPSSNSGEVVRMDFVSGATKLALGENHSCALTQNREAICWGGNYNGQLGSGDTSGNFTQSKVLLNEAIRDLAVGFDHGCVLTDSGQAYCFGNNNLGQLGLLDSPYQLAPVPVEQPEGVKRIFAGGNTSCGLTQSGGFVCFGSNRNGVQGNGFALSSSNDGVFSPSLNPFIRSRVNHAPVADAGPNLQIEPGTLRISAARSFDSDGDPLQYQFESSSLGISTALTNSPVLIVNAQQTGFHTVTVTVSDGNLTDFDSMGVQIGTVLTSKQKIVRSNRAPVANGRVTSLGYNAALEARGSFDPDQDALGFAWSVLDDPGHCATLSSADQSYTRLIGNPNCTQRDFVVELKVSDGELEDSIRLNVSLHQASSFTSLDLQEHSCALNENSVALCWGPNDKGQLGDGSQEDQGMPVAFPVMDVVQIAVGESHSCAIDKNGGLHCSGDNSSGQLFDGSRLSSNKPVLSPLNSQVLALALRDDQTCIVDKQNRLSCQGIASGDLQDHWKDLERGVVLPIEGVVQSMELVDSGIVINTQDKSWLYDGDLKEQAEDAGSTVHYTNGDGSIECQLEGSEAQCKVEAVEGMVEEISFELFEGDELKLGSRHLCILSSQGNISCAGYSSRNRIGNQSDEFIGTLAPIFSLDLAQ